MAAPRRIAATIIVLGLAAIMTVAVVTIALSQAGAGVPSDYPRRVAVPDIERRTTPSPSAAEACQATVNGNTATAVETATAVAGAGTVCFPGGTYTGDLAMIVPGQRWQLDPAAKLTGLLSIQASGTTLSGGIVERPTSDSWAHSVTVDADDVTIEDVHFRGGGLVISIQGNDRTQILDNDFAGQVNSAVAIWGDGIGADDTLIEGNTIVQSKTYKVSPLISRGSETIPYAVWNRRTVVHNNTIDQGQGALGWFGVELARSPGSLIVGNTIRGGGVLVSLPDSDGAIISNNRFDLRGSANWGVEIAGSDDVTVEDNTFTGDGPNSEDTAVSMNSGSLRALISANHAAGLGTLVNLTGNDHLIADNCLANVRNIIAYRSSAGADVDVTRNGPCSSG